MNQLATHCVRWDSVQVNNLPLIDILCHPWFREGFIDACRGRTPVNDFHGDTKAAWHYQRGRMVAGEARKTHGRIPPLWLETAAGSAINPQIISLAGAMFLTGAFA